MLKWNNQIIDQGHFPDGTLHMLLPKIESTPFSDFKVISWKYENDSELFALTCLVKAIRRIFGKDHLLSLYMPYLPHARMDRVQGQADVFTLKYFAEIINSLNFSHVRVLDPHSHVGECLIDNLYAYTPDSYIQRAMEDCTQSEDVMLFYPDEGAMKRYSGMMKLPYMYGVKNRDWETGKIQGLSVVGNASEVQGRNFLIVDDICSRGGTFLHSARKLKELGAKKIYLFVSHCENAVLKGELLDGDLIERVYTTDSIFSMEHPKIEVFGIYE